MAPCDEEVSSDGPAVASDTGVSRFDDGDGTSVVV